MTARDQPIPMHLGPDGRPIAFCWLGRWRQVAEIIEEWTYRPPWWEAGQVAAARSVQLGSAELPSADVDRRFFRVIAAGGGVFDLVRDHQGRGWVHRVFD